MTGNFLWRFLILLLIGLMASGVSSASSQDNTPSVYFYSREDKAFIVERADGMDRHVLVPYDLKEDYRGEQGIFGGGWSPSGRWFTWMGMHIGAPSYARDTFILDASTVSRVALSTDESVGGFRYTEWSPVEDLLLMVSYDTTDLPILIAQVYDPISQKVLLHITRADNFIAYEPIHWSTDGQSLTIEQPWKLDLVPLRRTLQNPPDTFSADAAISVFGSMAVLNGSLLNLNTREVIALTSATRFGPIDAVRWHPSGRWFFMASIVNDQYEIRFVDSAGHVSTDAPLCPLDSCACYGWMPER